MLKDFLGGLALIAVTVIAIAVMRMTFNAIFPPHVSPPYARYLHLQP